MYWKSVGPICLKYHSLATFCGNYFYKNDEEPAQYDLLRVKYINKLVKMILIVLPLMLISYMIVGVAPVYAFAIQHIRVTPLAIHLPFLEKDSTLEFYLNLALQNILIIYGLTGCLCIQYDQSYGYNHSRFNSIQFTRVLR